MKVQIVCYEDVNGWILGKFALKLKENLVSLGISANISTTPDVNADINHHIIYYDYDGKLNSIDTLMITHIDNIEKLELLKNQLKVASLGICMSSETMMNLIRLGIEKDKICYVNPAHDGIISIKKIVIGLSCRVQEDGRKREYFLGKLSKVLDNRFFKFKIMGDGWDNQVIILKKMGLEVDYLDHFDYNEYVKFIPSLDYYLYMGMDEGQMGFLDAVASGVKTIVTKQGYHLDAENSIVHPFTTYEELEQIFLSIQTEKGKIINSVSTWNWYDYTRKHVEIWKFLLDNKVRNSIYKDGLNSLLKKEIDPNLKNDDFTKIKTKELKRAKYLHYFFIKKRRLIEIIKSEGLSGLISMAYRKIKRT